MSCENMSCHGSNSTGIHRDIAYLHNGINLPMLPFPIGPIIKNIRTDRNTHTQTNGTENIQLPLIKEV